MLEGSSKHSTHTHTRRNSKVTCMFLSTEIDSDQRSTEEKIAITNGFVVNSIRNMVKDWMTARTRSIATFDRNLVFWMF